jgi:hypothetical protein
MEVAQVEEHMLCKLKTLSSNPSLRERERERERNAWH